MNTKLKLTSPKKAKRYFVKKLAFTTGPVELNRWMGEGQNINVVDVRRVEDYKRGHIPGAINVPKEKWHKPTGLKKDKINVVYCYSQVCHLAAAAACEFADMGFSVMELEGGFQTWKDFRLPVKKGAAKMTPAPKKISHSRHSKSHHEIPVESKKKIALETTDTMSAGVELPQDTAQTPSAQH